MRYFCSRYCALHIVVTNVATQRRGKRCWNTHKFSNQSPHMDATEYAHWRSYTTPTDGKYIPIRTGFLNSTLCEMCVCNTSRSFRRQIRLIEHLKGKCSARITATQSSCPFYATTFNRRIDICHASFRSEKYRNEFLLLLL